MAIFVEVGEPATLAAFATASTGALEASREASDCAASLALFSSASGFAVFATLTTASDCEARPLPTFVTASGACFAAFETTLVAPLVATPVDESPNTDAPSPASAPAPNRRIPKRLIQSAAAEDQEPAWPAATAKTMALNAGFARLFFDDAAALEFVRAEYAGTPLVAAYENAARPVMRADLFRLAAVAKLGGFWMDMDMVSKASLAPLADQADYGAAFPLEWWKDDAAFFARHRRKAMDADEHWQIGNYAFAAAPAHPLVTDALEEAVRRCEALEGSDAVSDLPDV